MITEVEAIPPITTFGIPSWVITFKEVLAASTPSTFAGTSEERAVAVSPRKAAVTRTIINSVKRINSI